MSVERHLPTGIIVLAGRLGDAERVLSICGATLVEIREEAVKSTPDVKRIAELADLALGHTTP